MRPDASGDGKVDLLSANYNANTLTVLTNIGRGGFALASSPGVGGFPVSVVAADVNGDGKVDLISANLNANTLTVLTNNGSGGFVLASSPGVGRVPQSVTAADVNGDGKVDLISANGSANTLTVLTNNGSGGFVLASSPGVGSNPYSVTAADVNGDGKVDLISANYSASTLSVLTNNGRGGFVLSSSPGVVGGPQLVTAADVNGDGKVDLISVNANANTLSVLFNTPSFTGNFTGDGSGLTALSADNISSGTLADARLSANVALLSGSQTFSGTKALTNSGNSFVGGFTGNGTGLTNLNASNLTSGAVPDARLSANVALRTGGNNLTGNQSVTGGNVGIGTTTPDSRLDVRGGAVLTDNVFGFGNIQQGPSPASTYLAAPAGDTLALYTASTERLRVTTNGSVGIGTTSPQASLHVNGSAYLAATLESSSTIGTWLSLINDAGGRYWNLIATGSGNGEGPGQLLFRDSTASATRMSIQTN